MKTLYIHLGTPKTATTALQVACAKSEALLHQHDYSFPLFPYTYPRVRNERNGHFLIEASMMHDAIHDEEATWQDRLELGLKMIHDEFEKYSNVILTDERLWSNLNYNKQNPLSILLRDAEEYGYCIKAVVYLRRQDHFLISRWNQLVKLGTMTTSASDNLKKMLTEKPLITDYAASLDNLAAQIGKENIIVRRFESSSWVNGSIYADFSDAIGLPSGVVLHSPGRDVNPGLKGNAVDIQLSINQLPLLTREDKLYFSLYTKKLSTDMPEDDQYSPLSPKETAAFLAQFEESNDRVAGEYIKDGNPLFSAEIPDIPKWSRHNSYYIKDVATFLSMLPPEKKEQLHIAAITSLSEKCSKIATLSQECARLETEHSNISKEVTSLKTSLKHPARTIGRKFVGKIKVCTQITN